MRARYYRLGAAPAAILTLEQVCNNLKVDVGDDDDVISRIIKTAQHFLEGSGLEIDGYLGKALLNQTWALETFAPDNRGRVAIEFGPLQSVQTVEVMVNGAYTTWDPANWRIARRGAAAPEIAPMPLAAWPRRDLREDAIKISFTAGYGATPDELPFPIIQAAHLLCAHLYQNREAVVSGPRLTIAVLPLGVSSLLAPYRKQPI